VVAADPSVHLDLVVALAGLECLGDVVEDDEPLGVPRGDRDEASRRVEEGTEHGVTVLQRLVERDPIHVLRRYLRPL
jgi:hypothetical protein